MEMTTETYHYPNLMGRILLLATEEIIGRNSVRALLNRTGLVNWVEQYPPHDQQRLFPFSAVSKLQSGLEELYGPRGGKGIAMRAGRSCFSYGLREFGPALGLTELSFRLMPLPMKLKVGANAFADIFNKYTDQQVRVEVAHGQLLWHIDRCPLCWQRSAVEPSCHLAVGLLQEALYWVSGGKLFRVEETHCIACGDASCTITIDTVPMG